MSARRTVVVHGATGTQGAPVVRRALRAGHRVRAVGRTPAAAGLPPGAEPVVADLADAEALTRAYAGADAVVVHLPGPAAPPDVAVAQADAVLAALRRAEVPQVVVNASGAVWDAPVGVGFLDARTRLAAGVHDAVARATVIAPVTRYAENLAEPWVLARLHRDGVLAQPAPPGQAAPWLALDDLAEIATALLGAAAPPARVTLVGPEELTGPQVADVLGRVLGRPVRYAAVAFDAYLADVAAGLGARYAAGLAALDAPGAAVPPPPAPDPATLRTGATTLEAWARGRRWDAPG